MCSAFNAPVISGHVFEKSSKIESTSVVYQDFNPGTN